MQLPQKLTSIPLPDFFTTWMRTWPFQRATVAPGVLQDEAALMGSVRRAVALEGRPRGVRRGDGGCRGVETTASKLFESVSEYGVFGGSGGLKNTRITQRKRNSLSWFRPIWSLRPAANDPYTQEHPKSRELQ